MPEKYQYIHSFSFFFLIRNTEKLIIIITNIISLQKTYSMSGMVAGAKDTKMSKIITNSCPQKTFNSVEKINMSASNWRGLSQRQSHVRPAILDSWVLLGSLHFFLF